MVWIPAVITWRLLLVVSVVWFWRIRRIIGIYVMRASGFMNLILLLTRLSRLRFSHLLNLLRVFVLVGEEVVVAEEVEVVRVVLTVTIAVVVAIVVEVIVVVVLLIVAIS